MKLFLKKSDSRLHNEVAFPFANPLLSMVLALPFHQWLQFSLIHLVCQAINTNNVPSMIQKRNVERERVRPEKKQKQRTHKPLLLVFGFFFFFFSLPATCGGWSNGGGERERVDVKCFWVYR